MGALFVTKSNTKAALTALSILCGIALPALAADSLSVNASTPSTAVQDREVKQAIEVITRVERLSGSPKAKKQVLRQQTKNADNILILGGSEAFPM